MQFYLIFPLLMVAISRFGAFSTALTLALVAFVTNQLVGLYLSPGVLGEFPQPSLILFKINIFMAGISLAFTYFNRDNLTSIRWFIVTGLSLATAPFQLWFAVLFLVFMLGFDTEKKEVFNQLGSSSVAKFFGDTSYSVYLLHTMIFVPVLYVLFQYSWFMDLHKYLRLMVAFVATAIPLYTLAYLLFRFVETPGVAFGRNVLRRKEKIVK